MSENHTATAFLVGAVLFAVVGAVKLLRGLSLVAGARRATAFDLLGGEPAKLRARAASAFRVSAVCFVGAAVGCLLVYVSLH